MSLLQLVALLVLVWLVVFVVILLSLNVGAHRDDKQLRKEGRLS